MNLTWQNRFYAINTHRQHKPKLLWLNPNKIFFILKNLKLRSISRQSYGSSAQFFDTVLKNGAILTSPLGRAHVYQFDEPEPERNS
jgi:hypothetical protein